MLGVMYNKSMFSVKRELELVKHYQINNKQFAANF